MKSKQVLDVQQMQHLQEVGLKLKWDTMLSWIVDERGKDKPLLCISQEATDYVDYSHYCIPAYTSQDVLDALPASIGYGRKLYVLKLDLFYNIVCYREIDTDETLVFVKFIEIPLIDAAYSLLCWTIKNKFVETNKNE